MKRLQHCTKRVITGLVALILTAFPFVNVMPAFADTSDSLWVTNQAPLFTVDQSPYTPPTDLFSVPCTNHTFTMPIFNQQTGTFETKQDECAVTTPFGTHGGTILQLPYDTKASVMRLSNGFGFALLHRDASDLLYEVPSSQSAGQFLFMYKDASTLFQKSPGFNQYQYVYTPRRAQPDLRLQNGLGASMVYRDFGFSKNGRWMVLQLLNGALARVDLQSTNTPDGGFDYVSFGSSSTPFPGTDNTQLAISDDGRYVGLSGRAQNTLRVFDLKDCMAQQPAMVNNVKRVEGCGVQDLGLLLGAHGVTQQYGRFLNFSYDNTALSLTAAVNGQSALVTLTAAGHATDQLDYLALGDSFSSGEGDNQGDLYYAPGTDTTMEKCHLSTRSYPYLLAQHMGVASNKFKSVACSGAVMRDIDGAPLPGDSSNRIEKYLGQGNRLGNLDDTAVHESKSLALQNFTPGRAAQIEFVSKYKPKVITVGIGGNDVDFGGKIQECASIGVCDYASDTSRRVQTGGEMSDQFFRLKKLYEKLHNASPQSKIYAVGYPIFAAENANACDNNARFDGQELTFMREGVRYFNKVIQQAAEAAGVGYLSVEDSLSGAELCSGAQATIAVNGLKSGNDIFFLIGNESFHPNHRGHSLMADAIEASTPNILLGTYCAGGATYCPNTGITQPPALSAYFATGATTATQLYVQAQNMFAVPGNIVYEVGNGPSLLLTAHDPNSAINVVVRSTPINLGSFTANANGVFSGSVTLPANLPAGPHELHVLGRTVTGQTIDLYQRIYAIGPAGDLDNNGTPDTNQACLLVTPSGQDQDSDGVDDACDPDLYTVPSDSVAPDVTGMPDREANDNGWYNNDVTIAWETTDPVPSSGAPTQPAATVASQEGEHTYTSGPSCDPLNNCATGSLALKIDKTAPIIGGPAWTSNPKPVNGTAMLQIVASDATSGLEEAEYYLGDIDPGKGSGATVNIVGDTLTTTFGTDFPTGVYKVTMRAKDKAGNWSNDVSDYLVVYNPDGIHMTGKKTMLPSLAAGDLLPGLVSNPQTDKAKFGFNVKYDNQGAIHPNSDFQFSYETGTKCSKPAQAQNCHSLELNATSIAWLTTQGVNHSAGTFQGAATLQLDGVTSQVVFRLTGLDGERLDATSTDHFTLAIFAQSANPNTAAPLYKVNADVLRGNIKIHSQ